MASCLRHHEVVDNLKNGVKDYDIINHHGEGHCGIIMRSQGNVKILHTTLKEGTPCFKHLPDNLHVKPNNFCVDSSLTDLSIREEDIGHAKRLTKELRGGPKAAHPCVRRRDHPSASAGAYPSSVGSAVGKLGPNLMKWLIAKK